MAGVSRTSKANIEIYNQQIERFRSRSKGLRAQAWVALFLIMLLLLSAVLIFFFASEIAKQDVSTEGEVELTKQITEEAAVEAKLVSVFEANDYDIQYEDLLSDIVALRENLRRSVSDKVNNYRKSQNSSLNEPRANNRQARVFDVKDEFKKESPLYLDVPRPLTSYVKSDQETILDRLEMFKPIELGIVSDQIMVRLISDNDLFQYVQTTYSEGERISGQIRELLDKARSEYVKVLESRSRSSEIRQKLDELREKNKAAANGGDITSSMTLLIQTNITRFGPMLVIFFFVTILVNLYRYSIRLSAYYEARADALFVLQSGIDSEKFDALVVALTPDNHDVGKAPKVPTDYVVDLAKTAVSKIPSGR